MTTLITFLATTAVILGIARYNESDSLFWKLFISLVGAYAAATVVHNVIDSKEQNKVVMVTELPTQVQQSVSCIPYALAEISLAATKREKSPKPVSKDSFITNNDSILSKVFVSARGQPQVESVFPILYGPDYFDTS